MLNIIICDDDPAFVTTLETQVNVFLQKQNIEPNFIRFYSGEDLLNWYLSDSASPQPKEVDFLFIDVEMPPGRNGLETITELRKRRVNCIVFFVSSHSQYMIDTYELNTFQYVLKPLDPHRLEQALLRGVNSWKKQKTKLFLDVDQKHIALPYDDIIMIESLNRKTSIYTLTNKYITREKISNLEKMLLPFHFLKTHRSFIINMDRVLFYKGYQFHLQKGYLADISYRQRAEIIRKYEAYAFQRGI
ncbi:DNA-binding response regulator, LytR/AlgR family [Eubacterium aggregans]|uniref:Stage 0 sporulation protein A homolog n=1 Tax=Eubacterium aggregans TaxID=81409 RepID=A0A1H4EMP9_9FIRM|nr:LytTR family DNA-binding domain-containing protein [Eubacterium aggregans]MDD4508422.1 LytTR family DNA-binding domain-containing protein [Eubacteriaceae bacterium]SEA86281.1 DNA-binding response regulator, LytR/AlgR family [Eubacterium aggregans]